MRIIANLHHRRNGASIGLVISSFMLMLGWASSGSRDAVAHGQSVLTQHNDNQRTGAQLQETQLTPATVAQSFGCLYTLNISSPASSTVDGCDVKMTGRPNTIGAQPLYVSHVVVNGYSHQVLYVATRQGLIHAFNVGGFPTPFWPKPLELIDPRNMRAEELQGMDGRYQDDPLRENPGKQNLCGQTHGPVGISGTPVIDETSNTMWVVYRTSSPFGPKQYNASGNNPYDAKFWIRKLDIRTGGKIGEQEIVLPANHPYRALFDPNKIITRPGLLLLHGVIYIAFSGAVCDTGAGEPKHRCAPGEDVRRCGVYDSNNKLIPKPVHGWILAIDAANLHVIDGLVTTPNGSMGGIWQSGSGLAADRNGNVFALTGNHEPANPPPAPPNYSPELADSFLRVRLAGNHLDAAQFTAPNFQVLDTGDSDPASGGPVVLPNGLALGGGKPGAFYLMDPAEWRVPRQQFQAFYNSWHPGIAPCELDADQSYGPNIHGSPVVWHPDGVPYALVYHMPEKEYLKAFRVFDDRRMEERPFLSTHDIGIRSPRGMPGGALSLSASGGHNGIVWVSVIQQDSGDGLNTAGNFFGRLIAFDALTLTKLWEASEKNVPFAKYIPPTIGGGKVFRSAYGDHIYVYGVPPPINRFGIQSQKNAPSPPNRLVTAPAASPINRLGIQSQQNAPSPPNRVVAAPARSAPFQFPQFAAIRPVTAAWRDQNHLDLFMTARQLSAGSVLSTDWEGADCSASKLKRAWRGWFPIDSQMETVDDTQKLPPGYSFITSGAAPVTASWHDPSHLDLFVAGNDGKVWSIAATPPTMIPTVTRVVTHQIGSFAVRKFWEAWFAVAPTSISVAQRQPITAVWRNANHLDLFTVDRNGRVMSIYFENGRWQPAWFAINPNSGVAGPGQQVAALWRPNTGHLDLFITGKDGKVLSTYFENNRWQPAWFPIDPQSGVAAPGQSVTAVWREPANNHLDLFITAADGRILSTYFDQNKWQPAWFALSAAGAAAPGQQVTALWRKNSGHLDLFITGKDGRIMSTYFDNNRWQAAWFPISPNTASAEPGQPVTALWSNANHLDLFITGKDGRVMSIFFDNNQWAPGWFTI